MRVKLAAKMLVIACPAMGFPMMPLSDKAYPGHVSLLYR